MVSVPGQLETDEFLIYGFGVAGKWLSQTLVGKLVGFVDTDVKKHGQVFSGASVYSIEEARKMTGEHTILVVSVVDILDVLETLDTIPCRRWFSLGELLNGGEITSGALPESAEFIRYTLDTVRECHRAFLGNTGLFLRSIDLVITEKCSLRCRDCANLMQFYERPVDLTFAETQQDVLNLLSKVQAVHEVRLIGGEPLMNKAFYRILEFLVQRDQISRIVVYSNATIPIRTEFAALLVHPKILFSLTDYGALSKNTERVVRQLDAMGVAYRLHPPENWTDSGRFIEPSHAGTPALKAKFAQCCGKNLFTSVGGRLYRCPFVANADRLHAIPDDPGNYVDLDASPDSVQRYLRELDYLPACDHCNGRAFDAPEIEPAIQVSAPIRFVRFPRDVIYPAP